MTKEVIEALVTMWKKDFDECYDDFMIFKFKEIPAVSLESLLFASKVIGKSYGILFGNDVDKDDILWRNVNQMSLKLFDMERKYADSIRERIGERK